MILKDYPVQELPREKAITKGISTLSNVELLAVILRTGNKQESVIEMAQRLLNEVGGISFLKDVDYHQLISLKGIKGAKAVSLLASVELAKRILSINEDKFILKSPEDVYHYIISELVFEKQERVYILCFNNKLQLLRSKLLFIGNFDTSLFSPLEIFKEAFLCNSSRIVLVHNHPSGNPTPSKQDISVTKQINEVSKSLEIECVDHIIIGNDRFYSFSANKIIKIER